MRAGRPRAGRAGPRRAALVAALALGACGDRSPMPTEELLFRVVPGAEEVEFGKPFPVEVVRAWEAGATPPAWSDDVLAPLVVDPVAVTTRTGDGRVEERRTFRARAFTLEDANVAPPPFEVSLGGGRTVTAPVPPAAVRVRPSLDRREPGAPELPGGMLRERPTALLATVAVGAAIALAVAVRARRRRGAAPPPSGDATAPPPPPGPDEVALRRLAALRARDVPTAAGVLAFHVEAADLLREYVRDRFAVRTAERTTEEVLAAIAAVPDAARRDAARAFGGCDLVKFATHVPSASERAAVLDAAERFVRETSPPERAGSAAA